MTNITLSVPEDIYRKMKKRSDIRWSEVARRAITEQLEKLEGPIGFNCSSRDLRRVLTDAGAELSRIGLDTAVAHYGKVRRLDWKRAFSTRVN